MFHNVPILQLNSVVSVLWGVQGQMTTLHTSYSDHPLALFIIS